MQPATAETVLGHDTVGAVQQLRPETSQEIKLTADTEVLCINRGREPLRDMFDSRNYCIEPGYFVCPFGAAKHFQARAVVPGSRNPELGFYAQASFIAILGIALPGATGLTIKREVDDREQWAPFTDDECRQFGHAVEAIDRAALVDPIDGVTAESAQVVRVSAGERLGPTSAPPASRVKAAGSGATRSRTATRIEGSGVKALKTKNAPGQNEATQQINAAIAAQASGAEIPEIE